MMEKKYAWLLFPLGLATLTIVIFLTVHTLAINKDYSKSLILVFCFAYPLLYCLFGLFSMNYYTKITQNKGIRGYFITSFFTMLFAGFTSLIFIYLFYNFINPEAAIVFKTQWLHNYISGQDPEKVAELTKKINPEMIKNLDLFSATRVFTFSSILTLFYIILSFILSVFFSKK